MTGKGPPARDDPSHDQTNHRHQQGLVVVILPVMANRLTVKFVHHLLELGVTIWVAEPQGDEFFRPRGWPNLTADGNEERLSDFRVGMALCANTGGVITVVDVDPRNGGDIEKVRALLNELKVRVFAELNTPGGASTSTSLATAACLTCTPSQTTRSCPASPGSIFNRLAATCSSPAPSDRISGQRLHHRVRRPGGAGHRG